MCRLVAAAATSGLPDGCSQPTAAHDRAGWVVVSCALPSSALLVWCPNGGGQGGLVRAGGAEVVLRVVWGLSMVEVMQRCREAGYKRAVGMVSNRAKTFTDALSIGMMAASL
jgi:hypothetical protein